MKQILGKILRAMILAIGIILYVHSIHNGWGILGAISSFAIGMGVVLNQK